MVMRWSLAVVVAAFLLVSCAAPLTDASTEPTEGGTSSTSIATTLQTLAPPEAASTTSAPEEQPFSGLGEARYVVASTDGIFTVDEDGNATLVWPRSVYIALSDLQDGLVYEASNRILKLRPGEVEEVLLSEEEGYFVFLHDVALLGDRPHVVHRPVPRVSLRSGGLLSGRYPLPSRSDATR
jgi:hypothetical protein